MHYIEPTAQQFSPVPPPTEIIRVGGTHRPARMAGICARSFQHLPSPRVRPSNRLPGAACEFVELRKHRVQHCFADAADTLLDTAAINGPQLEHQGDRSLQ